MNPLAERTCFSQAHKPADKPIFLYMAWQAVHEPVQAPASYIAPYASTEDDSRRIYAGMVACLDEGIGNITQVRKTPSWPGSWANFCLL